MTKEEWIKELKKKYEYDIYYFSGDYIFLIIKSEKNFFYEILNSLEYSTFVAITLCE